VEVPAIKNNFEIEIDRILVGYRGRHAKAGALSKVVSQVIDIFDQGNGLCPGGGFRHKCEIDECGGGGNAAIKQMLFVHGLGSLGSAVVTGGKCANGNPGNNNEN
jgi:hypothetical protein